MARAFTLNEICERALRKIGAYSINDTGADTASMAEARFWLDMIVSHVAMKQRRFWLLPSAYSLTLTAGVGAYNLRTSITGAPTLEFIVGVQAIPLTGTADPLPVEVMRRQDWEALPRESGGTPAWCWIDRTDDPTLHLLPTPAAPIQYNLEVLAQRFPSDTTSLQSTAPMPDVSRAWNLFLVTKLASELGDGPVRKLPADEVRGMQDSAARYLFDLERYEQREHADEPRRVSYNDF